MNINLYRCISLSQQKWKWCHKGTVLEKNGDRWGKSFLKSISSEEKELGDFRDLPFWENRCWWDKMPQFFRKENEYFMVKKWECLWGNFSCELSLEGCEIVSEEEYFNNIL